VRGLSTRLIDDENSVDRRGLWSPRHAAPLGFLREM
jgi:hypothetical protein